jgi:cytidylate kinase
MTQPAPSARHTVIAIDGGAASGKSTAAGAVAKALGFVHVDSGALYRALTWGALRSGIDPQDEDSVRAYALRVNFSAAIVDGAMRIRVGGYEPREQDIRGPGVTAAVSAVSAIAEVRALVNARLRALARTHDVVVEGRDIGTVVFPCATCKFFLTASPEERARRRKLDLDKLLQKTDATDAQRAADLERMKTELTERDRKDSCRAVDPLRAAPDAIVIDTTGHTVEQTAAVILEHVQRSGGAAKIS